MKASLTLLLLLLLAGQAATAGDTSSSREGKAPDSWLYRPDLRMRYLEASVLHDLESSHQVLLDYRQQIPPVGVERILLPRELREIVAQNYGARKVRISTLHFALLVQKRSIRRLEFSRFEEIPTGVALEPGDLIFLSQFQ